LLELAKNIRKPVPRFAMALLAKRVQKKIIENNICLS